MDISLTCSSPSVMNDDTVFEQLITIAHLESINLPLQIVNFNKFFFLPQYNDSCALSALRNGRFFTLTRKGRNVDIAEVRSDSTHDGIYHCRTCHRTHAFLIKDLLSTNLLYLNDNPLVFSKRLDVTELIHAYMRTLK